MPLHIRFTNAATKHQLPVRLRITGPAGETFVPLGRLPIFPCGPGEDVGGHVRVKAENWCYIDGGCEALLPAGVPLRFRATAGPEFEILDRTLELKPGQLALRFELNRTISDTWAGWIRMDARCHEISPAAAALEGAAEGLDVVQILARAGQMLAQDGNTYPVLRNLTDFSGQVPAFAAHGCEVFVNTFNRHPTLGSLGLLHSHRAVHPLAFGAPDGRDDWTLCDWADQCHRKRGLVTWVDAFRNPHAGFGALAALLLNKIDAVEIDPEPRSTPFLPWIYRIWNAGFPVPLVGASGKASNRAVLGALRTYAKITPELPTWIEAVGAGDSFVTNGPLLRLNVADNRVSVDVQTNVPYEKVEILFNGKVLPTKELPEGIGGWLAARVIGGAESPLYPGHAVFAHTSPIRIPGERPDPNPARDSLRTILERYRGWIDTTAEFTSAKSRAQHELELTAAFDAVKPETR